MKRVQRYGKLILFPVENKNQKRKEYVHFGNQIFKDTIIIKN